jgi:hypothetical protein
VIVDFFGNPRAFAKNVELEYERNGERYEFLRWGQKAFDNFRVVPPGTGICHQVNLEYLAQTVWTKKDEDDGGRKTGTFESPIPTRWSAPTRTPRWSTASPCSAGASAASRPRPHARPADLDADARGRRLQADRASSRKASPRPTSC